MKKLALALLASVLVTPFANAASDLIGAAQAVSLPYSETANNSAFTSLPGDDYCSEGPAGDFFYKYTPSADETVNIVAMGEDTEIYVFDLANGGSECVVGSDSDNVTNPDWFTDAYPETYDDCDAECSESVNVDLTAGIEYIFVIASNDDTSLGVIEVRMGSGVNSASRASNIVATAVPVAPVWLLGIMASLLGFVGIRKLRKS